MQPSESSHAINHPAPPQLRASHTPNVANATVRATSPITRPNSVGVRAAARGNA
jgi:hypothetical protein